MKDFIPSWFDIAAVIVVVVGLVRGRKNGMSNELFPLVQTLGIVVIASLVYKPLGAQLAAAAPVLGLLTSFIAAYLAVAILIKIIMGYVKKAAGEKLVGSDVFGRGEFYLGMLAGGVRFACFVIIFLALMHGREYTEADRARLAKMQSENFGSISLPSLSSLHHEIFSQSTIGQAAKRHLSSLLISPTRPGGAALRQPDSIGGRRERIIDGMVAPRQTSS